MSALAAFAQNDAPLSLRSDCGAICDWALMGEANFIGDEHFRYLESFTLAGLIYLVMNFPFLYLVSKFKDKHA